MFLARIWWVGTSMQLSHQSLLHVQGSFFPLFFFSCVPWHCITYVLLTVLSVLWVTSWNSCAPCEPTLKAIQYVLMLPSRVARSEPGGVCNRLVRSADLFIILVWPLKTIGIPCKCSHTRAAVCTTLSQFSRCGNLGWRHAVPPPLIVWCAVAVRVLWISRTALTAWKAMPHVARSMCLGNALLVEARALLHSCFLAMFCGELSYFSYTLDTVSAVMFLFLLKLASLLVACNPLVSFTLFSFLKTRVYTLFTGREITTCTHCYSHICHRSVANSQPTHNHSCQSR